ncbi:eukaryotic translation initiation factor 3 subunit A-like isoform X1 [Amphibalanus amphitrite]|uniref:eukaryotic translation initiation factor 3 subunit A-like isoform X1 n=2 Tax=Amphibalanus amphitrite TaxID=1232801 RepID=UPI001C91F98C|nr:eukaryotic translation initiation factor 3 subunit A-like isoform X1 [Amphibalanus amphitrite]XP_043218500.1 eukaryotic translation initiation factor 3 subunit A-like isoform X1 [Amphibalanus amphitrite]XP_043218502.1 eukaryotic translation initiation factor 3 subunit A-like isoform X1 [Amphibalanus amphitrite]
METLESVQSSVTTTETVTSTEGVEKKKKRRSEGKDGKKLRRRKKHDHEKENGGTGEPGAGSDSSRIHVRSYDSSKVIKKFSKAPAEESQTNCRACGRQVFQMERIKAERAVWHKDCFRCTECNKQLTVDTYASHDRQLYCKVHHKMLFKPKAVEEKEEEKRVPRLRRHELIIRESQPQELPPDVVRSSNKSDYGLDELQNLNVKDRFSVFEHTSADEQEKNAPAVEVKPSQNLLKKIKKFQARSQEGDIGVELEDMSSDEEEEEDEEEGVQRDPDVVRSASRKAKERPASFAAMDDTKRRFEEGHERRERLREERKGELTKLRGLICGASDRRKAYEETLTQAEKLKKTVEDPSAEIQNLNLKAYEEALRAAQEESPAGARAAEAVSRDRAADMASRFERGEVSQLDEDEETRRRKEEDAALFREAGTARGARSLFKELDASGAKEQVVMRSPSSAGRTEFRKSLYESEPAQEVVKSSSKSKDIHVETSALSSRFKFFETYKEPELKKKQFRFSPPREGTVKGDSPDREIERDPNVVRADDQEERLIRSDTTSRMLRQFQEMERQGGGQKEIQRAEKPQGNARSLLSKFRQMEEDAQREHLPDGPKPLKSFTPPPEYTEDTDSDSEYTYTDDSEYTSDEDSESGVVRSGSRVQDEFLTQRTDHARNLKAKFERWEQKMERDQRFDAEDECRPSLETARNLRSMFEAMKDQPAMPEKPKPKVNRFIGLPARRGEAAAVDADPESDPAAPQDSSWNHHPGEDGMGTTETSDRPRDTGGEAGGTSFWGDDNDDRNGANSFWDNNGTDQEQKNTPSFWERDEDSGKKTSFWDDDDGGRAPVSFWDRDDDAGRGTSSRAPAERGESRRAPREAGRGDSGEEESESESAEEESSEESEGSGSEDGAPAERAVRRRPSDD